MERRTFVKALPALPVLTGAVIAQDATARASKAFGNVFGA
jgi:hypothetical protein